MRRLEVEVIDSHTGGEPTRIVTVGAPCLGDGPLPERVKNFREKHDAFRELLIREPRGTDVLIGGVIQEPHDKSCDSAVIFFNNVAYLGMCGHGMIGYVVTLHHIGQLELGSHRIETPVGVVEATLHDANRVSIRNVESYRYRENVAIDVDGLGRVVGDIAWGGNWFFLVKEHSYEIAPANISQLSDFLIRVRNHLDQNEVTGEGGQLIDHIEMFGPATQADADSKNFVLCPGAEFDRSPCGTGTSAKVACLYADGKLKPGETFRQESIIGSLFEATIEEAGDGRVVPTITGSAFVHAESKLLSYDDDPFRSGIDFEKACDE